MTLLGLTSPCRHPADCIASKPVADRLDQRHDCSGGNGRVDGIAALLKHAQPGLRGQRVRGRHHVAREDRDAGGEVRIVEIEVHFGALFIRW